MTNNRNRHNPFFRDTPAGRRGYRDAMAGRPYPRPAVFDGWSRAKQRNYERGRLHAANVRAAFGRHAAATRLRHQVWEAAETIGPAVPPSRH